MVEEAKVLLRWDSPGKSIGVGCHFLPQCMKVKSESEITQLCFLTQYMDKGIVTHSSILSWSIPWTEEPSRLPWGPKESDVYYHASLLSRRLQPVLGPKVPRHAGFPRGH